MEKNPDLESTYITPEGNQFTVRGIIKNVTHRVLPTDSLIVDALLGGGEALDCFGLKTQDNETIRVSLENDKISKGLTILDAITDPAAKAEADDHTITGSHSIYRESATNKNDTIIQREFSSDILEHYNKVTVVANSPKKDIRSLLILKDVNKAKRKTLIELGFVTNHDNYLNIENNIDEVANQLIIGIKKNIKNNFFKKGKILGYYDKVKGLGLVNKPLDFDATKNKNRYDTIYEKINIL
jgi:hypothetical protein